MTISTIKFCHLSRSLGRTGTIMRRRQKHQRSLPNAVSSQTAEAAERLIVGCLTNGLAARSEPSL